MSQFYDRQGRPLTLEEWVALEERRDPDYRRVAETQCGQFWVSTVWLGLDHGVNWRASANYRPLIFETMVFPKDSFGDLWADRYSTEAEAQAGHKVAATWARHRHHGMTKHARDLRRAEMRARLRAEREAVR